MQEWQKKVDEHFTLVDSTIRGVEYARRETADVRSEVVLTHMYWHRPETGNSVSALRTVVAGRVHIHPSRR